MGLPRGLQCLLKIFAKDVSLVTQNVARGIDMRTHCSYAPSSRGAVERQNQTIKNKLAKCCEETGLTWLKALPIVLMYMRMRKRVKTNLSPFEILFGRPPFMGKEGVNKGCHQRMCVRMTC